MTYPVRTKSNCFMWCHSKSKPDLIVLSWHSKGNHCFMLWHSKCKPDLIVLSWHSKGKHGFMSWHSKCKPDQIVLSWHSKGKHGFMSWQSQCKPGLLVELDTVLICYFVLLLYKDVIHRTDSFVFSLCLRILVS